MSNQNQIATNGKTIQQMLLKAKNQFEMALPKHLSADRLMRVALTEMRRIPKLMEADPKSFVGSIMLCAQLGLEPGNGLGHVYLIPYGKQVNMIIGYKGMIELARRSGQIISLSAHEIYENDVFDFSYGLEEKLYHKPEIFNERGRLIGVYAIAQLVGGGHQFEVMSIKDVDEIKKRSKSGGSGPWITDYNEMAKKTVIRKLFKYLPVSVELQKATTLDESMEIGKYDTSFEIIDHETGEIFENDKTSQSDKLADKL